MTGMMQFEDPFRDDEEEEEDEQQPQWWNLEGSSNNPDQFSFIDDWVYYMGPRFDATLALQRKPVLGG